MTDTTLPDWLNLKLTPAQRAAAWDAEPHKPDPTRHREPTEADLADARLRERIAAGKAADDEVRALLSAHREQREQDEATERIASMKQAFEDKGYTPPPTRRRKAKPRLKPTQRATVPAKERKRKSGR